MFFVFLVFIILMNERQLHNSPTFTVLNVLSKFEKSQMISWSRFRSSWSGSYHHTINSKVMNFPKQGHYHYSCPWPNTFKKSFKSSWTTSCNSNQLEVTLFAINLPISYWYTGLYRVSMLHVPPPGQRGDKNLSSSSSNKIRLKVKIEKKMQTLMKARRSEDHCVFFGQNILRWRQLQNNCNASTA